jgi:hypothetical protein
MMYNELFKMLEERSRDDLRSYWMTIAGLQETILGPYIERAGLAGMHEYWGRIIEEENCDAEMELTSDYFEFRMRSCPSLSKNLDNDAGAFELYCDHCAGWVAPVVERHGYHLAYDMISRTEPRCVMRIYRDREKAVEFERNAKLLAGPYNKETEP